MRLMVLGTAVGLDFGLLLLCMGRVRDFTYGVWYYGGTGIGLIAVVYVECLRCELCCIVLRCELNWAYCSYVWGWSEM